MVGFDRFDCRQIRFFHSILERTCFDFLDHVADSDRPASERMVLYIAYIEVVVNDRSPTMSDERPRPADFFNSIMLI